jgi:hypothetical protein
VEPLQNNPENKENQLSHRSRGAGLVHEARIAKAGGGIPGISSYYQAMLYLVVLAAMAGAIWWAFSQGNP